MLLQFDEEDAKYLIKGLNCLLASTTHEETIKRLQTLKERVTCVL